MKHIYIINPAAGRADATATLTERIHAAYADSNHTDYPYEIYHTTGIGDACRYVRAYIAAHPTEATRFYACGGDGTLGEVVNGVLGTDASDVSPELFSVGLIPVGTGNDFMRNFTEQEKFLDLAAQRDGAEVSIDLLRCNDLYCVNMINIGFDCEVVTTTAEIKRKPYVPRGMAYPLATLYTLIRKPGVFPTIAIDGEEQPRRRMLLCAIGNGAFCGGGFHALPKAQPDDGTLDACLVNNVSRIRFLSLVGDYKKGTHVKPSTEKLLRYLQCHRITLTFEHPQNVCVDGEIMPMDACDISLVPRAVRFSVPAGCALRGASDHKTAQACPAVI